MVRFGRNLKQFEGVGGDTVEIQSKLQFVMFKASYRSMGTTGDPVPVGHRDGPDHHFTG